MGCWIVMAADASKFYPADPTRGCRKP